MTNIELVDTMETTETEEDKAGLLGVESKEQRNSERPIFALRTQGLYF